MNLQVSLSITDYSFLMNKLLPILLVVVLSGCGGEVKTTLEKCADFSMKYDDDVRLNATDKDVLEMSVDEFYNKYPSAQQPYYNSLEEWKLNVWERAKKGADLKISVYGNFFDKSLQDKLTNYKYETYFKYCEDERKPYPQTFDAKWQ